MKTKLPLILTVVSALGAPLVGAQEDRPPKDPVPRDAQRPPEGERPNPESGGPRERRPDRDRGPGGPELERGPGRPDGERGPGRPDGERGAGRPDGPRRSEGDRAFSPRGENPGRENAARPQKPTPFIGVMTMPAPAALASQIGLAEGFGLVVEEMVPDSPAAAAGVQRYDVIKAINDQQLVDPNQLAVLVRSYGKDKEVTLTILRKGQEQKLTLKIGERMLPERRALTLPLPNDFMPRLNELRERSEDYGRRIQESMRGFQDRVREYQEKFEQWRKQPGSSKPPEPPTFQPPNPPAPPNAPRSPEPPRPGDLLHEVRPGGAPQVRMDQDGAVTTWNTAQARIVVKDEQGELEVRNEAGHRTVVAKNPAGDVIFSGPVDTEEQRRALPEPVRKSLEKVRVQASVRGGSGPRDGGSPSAPSRVPLEREIQ